jgi:hypothetical protein
MIILKHFKTTYSLPNTKRVIQQVGRKALRQTGHNFLRSKKGSPKKVI